MSQRNDRVIFTFDAGNCYPRKVRTRAVLTRNQIAYTEDTPYTITVVGNREQIVKLLLDNGIEPTYKFEFAETPEQAGWTMPARVVDRRTKDEFFCFGPVEIVKDFPTYNLLWPNGTLARGGVVAVGDLLKWYDYIGPVQG